MMVRINARLKACSTHLRRANLCAGHRLLLRLSLLLRCRQLFLQDSHASVHVLLLQEEWRQEAQNRVLRHVDQQAVVVRAFENWLARNRQL